MGMREQVEVIRMKAVRPERMPPRVYEERRRRWRRGKSHGTKAIGNKLGVIFAFVICLGGIAYLVYENLTLKRHAEAADQKVAELTHRLEAISDELRSPAAQMAWYDATQKLIHNIRTENLYIDGVHRYYGGDPYAVLVKVKIDSANYASDQNFGKEITQLLKQIKHCYESNESTNLPQWSDLTVTLRVDVPPNGAQTMTLGFPQVLSAASLLN
jgi:hypothetical protein